MKEKVKNVLGSFLIQCALNVGVLVTYWCGMGISLFMLSLAIWTKIFVNKLKKNTFKNSANMAFALCQCLVYKKGNDIYFLVTCLITIQKERRTREAACENLYL